jgi:hypothetical protein
MDRSFTILMMLVVMATARQAQTYQVFNYTWIIQNQAGDAIFARLTVGSDPTLDPIIIDLCHLVLGAALYWEVPDLFWPLEKAPERSRAVINGAGACANAAQYAALKDQLFSKKRSF